MDIIQEIRSLGKRIKEKQLVTSCCLCHRIKKSETWDYDPHEWAYTISHGYCIDCYKMWKNHGIHLSRPQTFDLDIKYLGSLYNVKGVLILQKGEALDANIYRARQYDVNYRLLDTITDAGFFNGIKKLVLSISYQSKLAKE